MPSKIVRIYSGKESTVIGWGYDADATGDNRFARFMNEKGYSYDKIAPLAGSLSLNHTVVRPEMTDEHLKAFADLCTGADRGVPLGGGVASRLSLHLDTVLVLDNRIGHVNGHTPILAQG